VNDPRAPRPLASEVFVPVVLLFLAAVLVAIGAAAVVLPFAPNPAAAFLPLSIIVLADLAILYLFLRSLLQRTVLDPVDRIVGHAERIASGELDHSIPSESTAELDRIVDSVNTLASGLIREKSLLAENVASLDETNRLLSEASQELVRAARLASVGTLSAGVAHEIGNPLGAMRAYLDVLEGRLASGRPVDGLVEDLRTEVGRIDAIVQGILAFGRPAPHEPAEPFDDYSGMLDRALSELERAGALGGRTIVRDVEPGLPPVRAHPQHLERIVSNLVRNGVQSMEGTRVGCVTVRISAVPGQAPTLAARRDTDPVDLNYAHRRRLSELLTVRGVPRPAPAERDLVLEVTDDGPGIPGEVMEALFDPFFTTRPPGQGVGMGLALTARIVSELGGDIEARNRDVGGAAFHVRIPGIGPDAEAVP
jgi:two-component system, NtrC family, sensor kinase